MTRDDLTKKKIPDRPGVYVFVDPRRRPLYVGKAASLKNRVRSYFSRDLAATRGPRILEMVRRAAGVRVVPTDSVLEAMILEAHLIKKLAPPYNSREKDDKSFNYVVITREEYPRVLVVRGKELPERFPGSSARKVFGPFPEGGSLKQALSIVRKIFPFRDSCFPVSGKPCFSRQIGLCPGVCTGEVGAPEYRRQIRRIELFFEGKRRELASALAAAMRRHAARKEFESAAERKRQLFALSHIADVALIKDEYRAAGGARGFRTEAYDVAHTAGREMVGAMVTVVDALPDTSGYRKFKIRSADPGDDVGALREVLRRRFAHDEWILPHLIVVDGGAAQRNAAEAALREFGYAIPVASVVKDDRHRPRRILGRPDLVRLRESDILVANAEAHRFALAYHRARRGKIIPE